MTSPAANDGLPSSSSANPPPTGPNERSLKIREARSAFALAYGKDPPLQRPQREKPGDPIPRAGHGGSSLMASPSPNNNPLSTPKENETSPNADSATKAREEHIAYALTHWNDPPQPGSRIKGWVEIKHRTGHEGPIRFVKENGRTIGRRIEILELENLGKLLAAEAAQEEKEDAEGASSVESKESASDNVVGSCSTGGKKLYYITNHWPRYTLGTRYEG